MTAPHGPTLGGEDDPAASVADARRRPKRAWQAARRVRRAAHHHRLAAEQRGRRLLARLPRRVRTGIDLAHRVAVETVDDRVVGLAAEATLFTIISLPALLLVVLGSLGYVAAALGPEGAAELDRIVFELPRTILAADTFDSYQGLAAPCCPMAAPTSSGSGCCCRCGPAPGR